MHQAIKIFIKKAILIWSGACLIVLGIAGIVFPVFPGIILLFIGLIFILRGLGRTKERKYLKGTLKNIILKLKINNSLFNKIIALL